MSLSRERLGLLKPCCAFVFAFPQPGTRSWQRSLLRTPSVCGRRNRVGVACWRRSREQYTEDASVGLPGGYSAGVPRRLVLEAAADGRNRSLFRHERRHNRDASSVTRGSSAPSVPQEKRRRQGAGPTEGIIPDGINLRALLAVLCLFGLFMFATWSPNRRLALLSMLACFAIIGSLLLSSGRQVAGSQLDDLDNAFFSRGRSQNRLPVERLALLLGWSGGSNLVRNGQVSVRNRRRGEMPTSVQLQTSNAWDDAGMDHDDDDDEHIWQGTSSAAFFESRADSLRERARQVTGSSFRRLRPGAAHDVLPFASLEPSRDLFASHRREWHEASLDEDDVGTTRWIDDLTDTYVDDASDDIFGAGTDGDSAVFHQPSSEQTSEQQSRNGSRDGVSSMETMIGGAEALRDETSWRETKNASSSSSPIAIVPVEIVGTEDDLYTIVTEPDHQEEWSAVRAQQERFGTDAFVTDLPPTGRGFSRTLSSRYINQTRSNTTRPVDSMEKPPLTAEDVYFSNTPQRHRAKTGRAGLLRSLFLPLWQISRLALHDLQTKRGTATIASPRGSPLNAARGSRVSEFDQDTNVFYAEGFDAPASQDDVFQGAARWVSRSAPGLWRTLFGP
ncbi:hypothetical protein CCYA_CCYA14G3767 [Cyanidiococcus yangmingshanensis]|nr:hypothetical protein CCYA_CCYA14G3767 [Cyanidiococcus yangmingshanensis]